MRLLIVDDSKLSRMMLKAIVMDTYPDSEIIEASSGDEALSQVGDDHEIDMAIVDYNMPGMTGLDLFRRLNDQIPKRALLTANIQPHIREEAESIGVTFLNKPITEESVKPFILG